MSKLKQIFADLNGDADVVKQKYFAKKIVENFLLKEGKATVFKVYSIDYIEDQIFFEAIHKKSLNESIRFVEGIEKQINEGFFSAINDLGKKAWAGVKKVVSKVKDSVKNWWSGPVVGAVKTWNNAVKTAAKTHLGMMVDSQQYSETSYLFEAPWEDAESEGEAAGAENKAAPTQTDPSVAPEKEESSSKVAHKILGLLTPTKKLDAKKSGFASSIDKVRFFRIDGGSLYFGPEAGSTPYKVMTTTTTYLEVYMPAEFKGDKYAVGSLQDLITSLMTTDNKGLADFGQHIMGVDMSPAKLTIYDKSEKAFLVIPEKSVRMSGNGMKTIIVGGEESTATPASDGTTPAADGAKPADAAATPIDNKEAGVEEPTPEEKSEYNKIIDGAVAEAKAKGLPPTFYAGMSTTAEEVWGAFDKFAGNGANDYNPVMILVNSTEYAPSEMNELEYLSYLAAMPTFVNSLIKQPVPSQYEHQSGQYKSFLTAVQGATVSLAKVVNGNMTAKAPATASSSATPASAPTGRVEPTENAQTTADATVSAAMEKVRAATMSDTNRGLITNLINNSNPGTVARLVALTSDPEQMTLLNSMDPAVSKEYLETFDQFKSPLTPKHIVDFGIERPAEATQSIEDIRAYGISGSSAKILSTLKNGGVDINKPFTINDGIVIVRQGDQMADFDPSKSTVVAESAPASPSLRQDYEVVETPLPEITPANLEASKALLEQKAEAITKLGKEVEEGNLIVNAANLGPDHPAAKLVVMKQKALNAAIMDYNKAKTTIATLSKGTMTA